VCAWHGAYISGTLSSCLLWQTSGSGRGKARRAGNDTTTQGIFIPLIDLERPQRGGLCGRQYVEGEKNSIDCHGVLISYPVAGRVQMEGVEVNLCVLGKRL
jgi:hypothetical protein